MYQTKGIASDFNNELKRIRQKYRKGGFPLKFINEIIFNLERGKEEMIIPEWLFDERKTFQLGSHTVLRTRSLEKYLWGNSKISLMAK